MSSPLTSQGQIPKQGAPSMFSRPNVETPTEQKVDVKWCRDMTKGRGPVWGPEEACRAHRLWQGAQKAPASVPALGGPEGPESSGDLGWMRRPRGVDPWNQNQLAQHNAPRTSRHQSRMPRDPMAMLMVRGHGGTRAITCGPWGEYRPD